MNRYNHIPVVTSARNKTRPSSTITNAIEAIEYDYDVGILLILHDDIYHNHTFRQHINYLKLKRGPMSDKMDLIELLHQLDNYYIDNINDVEYMSYHTALASRLDYMCDHFHGLTNTLTVDNFMRPL